MRGGAYVINVFGTACRVSLFSKSSWAYTIRLSRCDGCGSRVPARAPRVLNAPGGELNKRRGGDEKGQVWDGMF